MEYFDYQDWLVEGRRRAKKIGKPDLDTEQLLLETERQRILIVYACQLQTVSFDTVVAEYSDEQFSRRFFNMLAVEG